MGFMKCVAVRRINPNNSDAYLKRGDVRRIWLKEYQPAIQDYSQVLLINPQDSYVYTKRGDIYAELKNYQAAIQDYNQALLINPKADYVYIKRGDIYAQLKNYQAAIQDYTQALRTDSTSSLTKADAYIKRGDIYTQFKDYNSAIQDYSQALEIVSYRADVYIKRGDIYAQLKDYQAAIKDYSRALELRPRDSDVYLKRIHAFIELRDYKSALVDYMRAFLVSLERVTNNHNNHNNLASAKQSTSINIFVSFALCLAWILSISVHEFGHAIIAYWGGDKSVKQKGYLTLNPIKYVHPLASIILPGFFFILGDFFLPGAAVYIQEQNLRNRWWKSGVSASGPVASFFVFLLLLIFFKLTLAANVPYWVSAVLASFIALKFFFVLFNLMPIPPLDGYRIIEPWLPKTIQTKIRKYWFLGLIAIYVLFPPTIGVILAILALFISFILGVPVAYAVSGFQLFNRQYTALFFFIFVIFVLICQRHSVWNLIGVMYSALKKYKQALFAYDKAIKIQPNDEFAWGHRGWTLEQLGRYEEALVNWDKAIELNPKDAWHWGHRGWTLEQLGRYEEALVNWDKAIELNAQDASYWRQRGQALEKLGRYEAANASYQQAIELEANNNLGLTSQS